MRVTFESSIGEGEGVIPSSNLSTFQERVRNALEEELTLPAKKAESIARRVHKYQNRTGRLAANTFVKVKDYGASAGVGVEGYVDASVDYAERIIRGGAGRSPDPFIEEALSVTSSEFLSAVDRALEKALDEALGGI
jgi:hypothetical protein